MNRSALPLFLFIALELGSASMGTTRGPAPAPKAGRLDYDLIYREPVSTGTAAEVRRRSGSRHPPKMRLQKSRHQIWFKGPMVRVDMTSQPPGAPLAQAANVTVDYRRSDGKPSTLIVPDGYSLIRNHQGTFILRRGSGDASLLTSRKEPFLNPRSGALPSLPIVDRSLFSRWKPGKVGSEPVGRYHTDIYEIDSVVSKPTPRRNFFRIWVSDELPVPVKLRSRYGDVEREEVLRAAQFHVTVPESVFRLPAGTKIRESRPEEDE